MCVSVGEGGRGVGGTIILLSKPCIFEGEGGDPALDLSLYTTRIEALSIKRKAVTRVT